MLDLEKIKIAYNNALFFKSLESSYQIDLRVSENANTNTIDKSLENFNNIIKFWSNDYKYDTPIVIVSTDENGYEFLSDQLRSLNFADAIPSQEKWNTNYGRGVFGSGGYSVINGKKVLLYWQVIGSQVEFEHTGDLKTGPHLFTHSIQTVMFDNYKKTATDFPGWYVEGQADFAALMSISNTFDEYIEHRKNFFKYAFIPAGERRKEMKQLSEKEWSDSLRLSPQKFKGIPLVDEYYTGLLAYEEMMYKLTHKDMMEFYKRFVRGEHYDDLFVYFMRKDPNKFYSELGKDLVELAKTIHA